MTFSYAGSHGRYIAELQIKRKDGSIAQRAETMFTHESEDAQLADYGQIEGKLDFAGGGSASNTTVELVNDKGEVIQRTTSTDQGNYRFKNVSKGGYKLRVSKKGFAAKEAEVQAAPAAPAAKADMTLH